MNNIWNKEIEKEIIDIFRHLIGLKTINSNNNEMIAVDYIDTLLKKEGINRIIIEPSRGRGNIIAKLEGGKKAPIVFISHLDVVDVDERQWEYDPFAATVKDGIIYGRGTLDTKQLTVMGLITLILLKRNSIELNRDIVFIATADEENGSKYGMEHIANYYPHLIPKGFVIDEGGGFVLEAKDRLYRTCACGAKGSCDIKVIINPDSEEDTQLLENAMMLRLAKVLERLASYKSGELLCSVSRRFRELAWDHISIDDTMNNLWDYMTHNTLGINGFNIEKTDKIDEPIELSVNFRFIPGSLKKDIVDIIKDLLNEFSFVQWEVLGYRDGYESAIDNDFIKLLEDKSNKYGKKATLLPIIVLGNTDGRFIGHNVYGYSPLLEDIPFKEVLEKVHSHNEYITINSLIFGCKVLFEVAIKMLEEGGPYDEKTI